MSKFEQKIYFPIEFSIIGATSEDPEHPLYSIISNEKKDGWCSAAFCKYPQEIIIQLNKSAKLHQINLTLHETKIPTKIDFYYYYPDKKDKNKNEKIDLNHIPFIQLGFINPNSNQKTNFKAREFHRIKINQNVLFIKFVLHKNYINLENKYNQVSLVGVEFLGIELENDSDSLYNINNNLYNNKEISNQHNDEDLDEVCLNKLKEIKITLDLCIKKEKYESAKIFRELYHRVRLLGEKIKNLTDSKLKCIETNDFDSCKKIQNDIDRMKALINGINANYPDNNENEEENEDDSPFK